MFDTPTLTISVEKSMLAYHEAVWDSSYLHNKTIEIESLSFPTVAAAQQLLDALIQKEHLHAKDLLVIKLAPYMTNLYRSLVPLGFWEVEDVVEVSFSLHRWNPNDYKEYLRDDYFLRPATSHDIPALMDIARTSFTADRFHLDPTIPKEFANDRYAGWVKTSMESSDEVFAYVNNQNGYAGFFIVAKQKDNVNLRLAGLDPSMMGKGLGKLLYFSMLRILKERGDAEITTQISLRNIAVLNVYTYLVHPKMTNPTVILHKTI